MNFFITGLPGSGKSTLVQELLKELKGRKIAGIITPEIREGGVRKGFKIIDLASGKERIMSYVSFSGPTVGKYGVSVENIDFILGEFEKSLGDAEIVVIDEIGPMEFKSARFRGMIEKLFTKSKIIIATVKSSMIGGFKGKGKVFWVNKNVDELKGGILRTIP